MDTRLRYAAEIVGVALGAALIALVGFQVPVASAVRTGLLGGAVALAVVALDARRPDGE